MKKLYLTLAAALIGTASMAARELTFYLGNTPIANEETVTFKDIETVPIGGGATLVTMAPQLYLHSDIKMTQLIISAKCVSGQSISLCVNNSCENDVEIEKEKVTIQANEKMDLQFEYIDNLPSGQQIPQVVTDFMAMESGRENTKKTFTLIMNPTNGVASVIAGNDQFRAVSGGIEYSFDAPTAVAIYSITGQKTISTQLNGNGTLSTSELPAGVYVYTLNGKSGKIYIR